MARLNVASQRAATPDRARPPALSSHPSTSTDAEAASLQLLTEAASATKMPHSTAVDGANLLNAARVHAPSTALKKDGKLSRPSILANEQPRTNLASRGNLYDVLSSPEKDSFSLSDKINRKPLKVAKKTKLPRASTHESTVDEVNIVETHSSGNPRCTAVYYKYDKEKGSHYRQCHRPGPNDSDVGPRCKTHILNTPVVRCEHATTMDTGTAQCPKAASNETAHGPRCAEHAEQPARGATRKTQPQVQIPVRPRSKQAKSTTIVTEDTSHITQTDDEPNTVAEVPPQSTLNGKQKRRKPQQSKAKTSGSHISSTAKEKTTETATTTNKSKATVKKSKAKEPTTIPTGDDISDPHEINTDGDQSENPSSSDEEETKPQHDIHDVFKYLISDECSGQCETKLGDDIRQTCEESWLLVRAKDTSANTIADDIKTIRTEMDRILADIPKEDRPAFKGDAYAYIFRALVSYLEAVYNWLRKKYSEVTDSLDAMRMLCSLIRVILGLKDVIYSWRVSAPPRSDGEAVIKIVDSKLIVPLRKVDATFRTQLRYLKAQETHNQRQAELKRKRAEGAEEERRRAEDEIGKLERWKRWQDLHVLRMQLEPDAFRRRKRLMIKKPDSLEERDANGVRFERVPIFKVRSSLVRHWISIAHEDREWTTAEEEALLKGLQDFAGPKVFENIFKEYCHAPHGILRDFSVSSIFAKAAWFHSQCVALSQEREGFEVPTYLAELPTILSMYPSPTLSY